MALTCPPPASQLVPKVPAIEMPTRVVATTIPVVVDKVLEMEAEVEVEMVRIMALVARPVVRRSKVVVGWMGWDGLGR